MAQRICPVDVISVCRSDGAISPLRFRIEDAANGILRGDICGVVDTKEICFTGAEAHIFLCKASISGEIRTVELKYHVRSHTWWLVNFKY